MKISKIIYRVFLLIFLSSIFSLSFSNENKLNNYFKTVRCLVCEGQNIHESDTEFAINLKEQIKKKFDSGMSINQINEELISIFGEQISYKPSNRHLLLWLAPVILLILIVLLVKRKFSSKKI